MNEIKTVEDMMRYLVTVEVKGNAPWADNAI